MLPANNEDNMSFTECADDLNRVCEGSSCRQYHIEFLRNLAFFTINFTAVCNSAFVNSPNAIDGNEISRCDTSSAAFQSEEAGIVDVVAGEADPDAFTRFI